MRNIKITRIKVTSHVLYIQAVTVRLFFSKSWRNVGTAEVPLGI